MQFEYFPIARGSQLRLASRVSLVIAFALASVAALPASAATLDRIKETGHIKLGYLTDYRPFTSRSEAGDVEGYGAALCQQVVEHVKTKLSLSSLTVDWVPVMGDDRLREVKQGNVDLLCAPATETLSRRQDVSFSIPVFPSGIRAVVRSNAPEALRNALSETPSTRPVWRGSPAAKLLEKTTFAVTSGTTTEQFLERALTRFQLPARVVKVPDYRTGLQQLQDRKADVFFGDRTVVLGALDPAARSNYLILDRMLTHEPVALAMARGDEDFRLLVDTALSQTISSDGFADLYTKWIGEFDDWTRRFFAWATLAP